ncbi:MAG: PIN domain-containing protein [Caulobacteraceae bacterium]
MTTKYLLDANVLYSYTLRDIFITLATRGLRIHWSTQIETEFVRARGRKSPEQAIKAKAVVGLMRRAVPDWKASASRAYIASLDLPDPDDRHVLAAAIQAGAQVIVTDNRRDFPPATLEAHGITLMSPDQVLCSLHDADPEGIVAAAAEMRARMVNPSRFPGEWLERLEAAGARALAGRLRPFSARL